jgi:hypothetical protein
MSQKFVVADIRSTLLQRLYPSITMWNRLEGRPRTNNFTRALKAEINDALWMLTRQWQMGEFQGDDAGSPVFAKLQLHKTELTQYKPDGHAAESFDDDIPLETIVERRPIALTLKNPDQDIALDIRLLMGRYWLKLVKQVGNFEQAFIDEYSFSVPDPTAFDDVYRTAHPEVWASFVAVAGRRMDGGKLYLHLKAGGHAYDNITNIPAEQGDMDTFAGKFIAWYEQLFNQPAQPDAGAWLPDRLEYQFAVSAPVNDGENVYAAEEYYHGRLDWYNFSIDPSVKELGAPPDPAAPTPVDLPARTFIPTSISFDGMPNTRWWAFEDRRTNFGDIKPDTTDIAKLLLMEFGLVYANDWFIVPQSLPVGSVANVKGMMVTNVFGERLWIEAAGRGLDDAWNRWSMFMLNTRGDMGEAADTSLLLLPTVPKIQEGKPTEETVLIRDEMANMVWGIEKVVPLASGESKPGAEAARETLNNYQMLLSSPPPSPEPKAKIRYRVMNSVPEHWIPFIPVRIGDPNDSRQIQLQRAAMPPTLAGDPRTKVRPRTILLREGLDRTVRAPYFLHEEEVPRAGIQVSQSFQRTRWTKGRVFVWLGVHKQTGRGEGSSGLAFDQIIDVAPKPS